MNYHYVTGLGPNENTISFSTVLILAGIMEPPLLKFMPTGSQQNKMTLLKGTTAVSYQASRNCTASKVIISNEAYQCTLSNVVFIPDTTYQTQRKDPSAEERFHSKSNIQKESHTEIEK